MTKKGIRGCSLFTDGMVSFTPLVFFLLLLLATLHPCNSVDKSCQEGAYKTTEGPYGRCAGFRDCEPGSYCITGIKKLCPAGTYGNISALTTRKCSGPCPAGYFCPEATTSPIICGSAGVYCPQGSGAPIEVKIGYYAVGSIDNEGKTMKSQEICPVGHYCQDGVKFPCPARYYGSSKGLSSSVCTGLCQAGYYCPIGSISGREHTCGSNRADQYCPEGSARPSITSMGYYALANDDMYEEDFQISMLEPAARAVGGFISQEICPRGSFCHKGIAYLCPPGRYGSSKQETNASCTGECAAGWYCPAGSISAVEMPCGKPHLYCPTGSSAPLKVERGYYSTESDPILDVALLSSKDIYGQSTEITGTNLTTSDSEFTASWVSTTTLTVTSMTRGTILIGQYLYGRGITDGTRIIEATQTASFIGVTHVNGTIQILSMTSGSIRVGDLLRGSGIPPLCRVLSIEEGGGMSPFTGLYDLNATGWIQASLPINENDRWNDGGTVRDVPITTVNTGVGTYRMSQTQQDAGTDVTLKTADPSIKRAIYYEHIHRETKVAQRACPVGNFCVDGLRIHCPEGTYGNITGLSSASCSGPCEEGYYCPRNSTSPSENICGDVSVFCPEGSGRPLAVDVGYYTVASMGDDTAGERDSTVGAVVVENNNTLAIRQVSREKRVAERLCPSGHYCIGGLKYMCPAGKYGQTFGLSSSNCTGLCQEGYLCPQGSYFINQTHCGDPSLYCPNKGMDVPFKVPEGSYSVGGDGPESRTGYIIAPKGYYATRGLLYPCPAGYYGALEGLSSPQCSGPCTIRGFYCPIASTSPVIHACGSDDVYCDGDRTVAPVKVLAGFYTVDYMSLYPHVQEEVIEVSPIDYPDQMGRLSTSTYRTAQLIYQQYSFSMAPSNVARSPCPPGQYRDWSQHANTSHGFDYYSSVLTYDHIPECSLCPDGTYKAMNGDHPSLCLPCNPGASIGGSVSTPNRTVCECTTIVSGQLESGLGIYYFNIATGTCSFVAQSDVIFLDDGLYGENISLTRYRQFECEPGYFCRNGLRFPCPAGSYGSASRETRETCEGLCPAGYFCLEASTTPTANLCGSEQVYCPVGSSAPRYVSVGYYTNESDPAFARTNQSRCPPGSYCTSDGLRHLCPKGTYARREKITDPMCEGMCEGGYYCEEGSDNKKQYVCGDSSVYCPPGSWAPTPVTNGFYCIHAGIDAGALDLIDRDGVIPDSLEDEPIMTNKKLCSAEVPCEPGHFCSGGIMYPCPAGTYGFRYFLDSHQCDGQCAAGYYCPSTLRPQEHPDAPDPLLFDIKWPLAPHLLAAGIGFECGDVRLYCPQGSFYPKVVSGGYYTIGTDMSERVDVNITNTTRIAQVICPRGNFCRNGIAYNCPKGYYGDTEGEIDEKCTSWCPPGHYCPEGTADPIPCPPGHFSSAGAFSCTLCPGISTLNATMQLEQGITLTRPHASKVKLPCQNERSCCFMFSREDIYEYDICNLKCKSKYSDDSLDDSEYSTYCQCTAFSVTTSDGFYYVDGVQQKTLTLFRQRKYVFDVGDISLYDPSHPLKFSSDSTNLNEVDDVLYQVVRKGTIGTTGSTISIVIPSNHSGQLYYHCGNHKGMGGDITVYPNITSDELNLAPTPTDNTVSVGIAGYSSNTGYTSPTSSGDTSSTYTAPTPTPPTYTAPNPTPPTYTAPNPTPPTYTAPTPPSGGGYGGYGY